MSLYENLVNEELIYKHFYELLPSAWEKPIDNWEEMVQRYHKAGILDIPGKPLSEMGMVLTEESFFKEQDQEIVCFNNLRYCPPFIHKLKFIKIIYVYQGSVIVYLNGVKHRITSGGFCIVTPEVVHTVFSRYDEDVVVNILMKESFFSNVFSSILAEQNILTDFFWKILYTKHSNRILLFQCRNDERLDRLVEKMRAEAAREEGSSRLLMKSYAMIFLGMIMRDHLAELSTLEELTDEVYVMPEIINEMKKNLKTITLTGLSEKFGMKEENLKHYIVRESGYTYSHLLQDLRLKRAIWFLENTSLSVENIMEEVGYSNTTNFYNNFKAKLGKTPLEYRKSRNALV